jgi:hypothetical protein
MEWYLLEHRDNVIFTLFWYGKQNSGYKEASKIIALDFILCLKLMYV